MKPSSLDEHWEQLTLECDCAGVCMPRAAIAVYRAMLVYLRWLSRRIARRTS